MVGIARVYSSSVVCMEAVKIADVKAWVRVCSGAYFETVNRVDVIVETEDCSDGFLETIVIVDSIANFSDVCMVAVEDEGFIILADVEDCSNICSVTTKEDVTELVEILPCVFVDTVDGVSFIAVVENSINGCSVAVNEVTVKTDVEIHCDAFSVTVYSCDVMVCKEIC